MIIALICYLLGLQLSLALHDTAELSGLETYQENQGGNSI